MNTLFVMILLFAAAVLIGLVIICRACVIPHCCNCMQWLCRVLANKLMYNSVIRGLLEAYFLTAIATVYQLSNTDFAQDGYFNFFVAIATAIYLLAFPIFSLRFLLRNKDKLETPALNDKYGSLYQNVDPRRSVALRFTTYFCMRRLVFAGLICLATQSLVIQVMIADFAILAMLVFYTSNLPMKDSLNNFVQIFNETAIILLLQTLFVFTDFMEDPVTRHDYGYYFLYYVAVLMLMNIMVLCFSLARDTKIYFRKRKAKARVKKLSKEARAKKYEIKQVLKE